MGQAERGVVVMVDGQRGVVVMVGGQRGVGHSVLNKNDWRDVRSQSPCLNNNWPCLIKINWRGPGDDVGPGRVLAGEPA